MSKQRPNPDTLANELAGASAFFRQSPPNQSAPTPAPVSPTPAVSQSSKSHSEAEKEARTPRTPVRPDRRQMIRHAFEMYLDQLDALRTLADDQRRRGEPASMSRMVREAIDQYLDRQADSPDRP